MSSSSAFTQQFPHPMKKKVISALVAVVIGHIGILWAVSHIKTPELKSIEKKPLQVRFVKIQQSKPLAPAPKVENKKAEPPKPVKDVQVVEKPLPVPPPKKVEKVQQVKKAEMLKPVVNKPVQAQPKPVSVPVVTETPAVKAIPPQPAANPVAAPVQPAPKPVAAPVPTGPKIVSIGDAGVQWSRTPRLSYSNKDLQGENRRVTVLIEANEQGTITSARITRSSGIAALDEKILRAVRNAKFKPYKEKGVAYLIHAEQLFQLTLNPNG